VGFRQNQSTNQNIQINNKDGFLNFQFLEKVATLWYSKWQQSHLNQQQKHSNLGTSYGFFVNQLDLVLKHNFFSDQIIFWSEFIQAVTTVVLQETQLFKETMIRLV
jgi:hypothetical protein